MRNYRWLVYVIRFFLGVLLLGCTGTQKAGADNPQVIVTTTLDNVSPSDIERVKKEAEKALNSVCPILGIKNNKTIRIRIVDQGVCMVMGESISLPIWHIRNRNAAIVHEVTHMIAKHGENAFFSEGLAIYFQERLGEDHGFPNFSGVPLDDLVRSRQGQLIPIYKLVKNNDIFGQIGAEQREIAYIEAGSFINFLAETYGEQKLAELHDSRTLNYKKVYGKDIKHLEVEWKKSVLR